MTIGITFPVKSHDTITSVPWGLLEPHRNEAITVHGLSLERLYALGGLTLAEIATLTGTGLEVLERAHAPKANEPPP